MQLRFGDHVLDIARRELRRGGEPVALQPQVFDLLVYLIRNRDRVVTKDDLVSAVWGGRCRGLSFDELAGYALEDDRLLLGGGKGDAERACAATKSRRPSVASSCGHEAADGKRWRRPCPATGSRAKHFSTACCRRPTPDCQHLSARRESQHKYRARLCIR